MSEDYNKDRLGSLVAMATRGYGNEKDIAIRKVRALCKKHNLDFDEVMGEGEQLKEYLFYWKQKKYEQIVSQIVSVYALTKDEPVFENRLRKVLFVKTTQTKYIETLNAIDVLTKLYDKEKRKAKQAFHYGFLEKHNLWNPFPREGKQKFTKAELEARRAGSALADIMEDANIRKRLN
jgi:hypothetical protein